MKFAQVISLFLPMTQQGRHISASDVSHFSRPDVKVLILTHTVILLLNCFRRTVKSMSSHSISSVMASVISQE